MEKIMLFCVIAGALLVTGCAGGTPSAQPFSYSGVAELELVRELGPPDRSYAVGDNKFLSYTSRRTQILRGVEGARMLEGPVLMTGAPSRVVQKYCVTTFEVAGGKVVDWKAQGNDCPVF
jgi:hypothetical protein